MDKLTRLFEPINIGSLKLKNRVVMCGFGLSTPEDTSKVGVLHERYVDFFAERARGETGLIILPDTVIDRNLRFRSHPCIGGDEFMPGLHALTEAVHMWGGRIAPDLWYSDNMYRDYPEWNPPYPYGNDWRPLSTSPGRFINKPVISMSPREIREVQDLFADASARAVAAGFDAIQLAGHFGFIFNQYLSPYFNKRTDQYGGSLENRLRFTLETLDIIKQRIGDALPIIFRLSADELTPGGLRIGDTQIIARRLEQAGVAALNVTAGLCWMGHLYKIMPPTGTPKGVFVELAARIREAVSIPVIVATRITDPLHAENILAEGKADLIGMARQLVADPEWTVKAAAGRYTDIVPCIGCNACVQRLGTGLSRCSVNAALGREREFAIRPAARPKKVLVAGGGPAGLEAARVAALRGHQVTLLEKGPVLGGQLALAATPPFKDEIGSLTDYLAGQIKALGVRVRLDTEATAEIVAAEAADVVIVATGARPAVPSLPGVHQKNVLTAWDVLAGAAVGHRVAVVGGGMVGCETAEYLVRKGHDVTIIEMLSDIALDAERSTVRPTLMERFADYPFTILIGSRVTAIQPGGVMVKGPEGERLVSADHVVLALGVTSCDELAGDLRGSTARVFTVGDSFKPGKIIDAVNHASFIARQI
jgi:2,4-dienoyl-CoA reductase-like NADH-dependent reductase (Old Yellow Enzyme family)/thioredoxin reductase